MDSQKTKTLEKTIRCTFTHKNYNAIDEIESMVRLKSHLRSIKSEKTTIITKKSEVVYLFEFKNQRLVSSIQKVVDLPHGWDFHITKTTRESLRIMVETKDYEVLEILEGVSGIEPMWFKPKVEKAEVTDKRKKQLLESGRRYREKRKIEGKTSTAKMRAANSARVNRYKEKKKKEIEFQKYECFPYKYSTREEIEILIKNGDLDEKIYEEEYQSTMEDIWNGKYDWIEDYVNQQ